MRFVFYKLPHLWNHPDNVPISNGTGFLYFDVNNKNWVCFFLIEVLPIIINFRNLCHKEWMLRIMPYIIPSNSTITRIWIRSDNTWTLLFLKVNFQTFSYMYNDEWPDSTIWSNSSGHAKGVTVFDQYTGFWMIHSIPKFPSKDMFRFPSNAHYYGQMGICISYNTVSLATIGNTVGYTSYFKEIYYSAQQLFYYNTFTYQFNLPQSFANQFPVLSQLKNKEYNKVGIFLRLTTIPVSKWYNIL